MWIQWLCRQGSAKGLTEHYSCPPSPLICAKDRAVGSVVELPICMPKGPDSSLQGLGRRWIATVSQIKGNPGPCATWGWDCIMRI